jgi:ribosome-associated toxin RatA of RatAB toxin-antitoxin module
MARDRRRRISWSSRLAVVEKSALLPYSAAAMYRLVSDMERYPEFLPWCSGARLISHTGDELCGEIEVSRLGITQRFSTCNRLWENERMELRLHEGPFRRLDGAWDFKPLREDACKVSLRLEFEFSGKLIDKAFGAVFSQIANSLVDAFSKRAQEVYGGRQPD